MKSSTRQTLKVYSITIAIAVSLALTIRKYVIESYRVPSQVMSPTLASGDVIFVSKWPFESQKKTKPQRGDVIVFNQPTEVPMRNAFLIRRIIGTQGDRVGLKDGIAYLNGKPLSAAGFGSRPCTDESLPTGKTYTVCRQASYSSLSPTLASFQLKTVPPEHVFVAGDLRTEIAASQTMNWGIVPISAIIGKAQFTWLSFEKKRMFRRVE